MSLTTSDVLFPPSSSTPLADLDWATGIMRFFDDRAEFVRLLQLADSASFASLNDDDRYTMETLTHEGTHRLQLLLTGFAYDFSFRLLRVAANAAQEWSSLDELNRHRRDYLSRLWPIFEMLDRQGPEEMTPRIILESAAYMAQKLTHYPDIGWATYERLLADDGVDEEYYRAYDVASRYVREDALEQVTHVANLALATSEPEKVFVPLLKLFRDHGSRLDTEHNQRLGLAFLNSNHDDILLGSSMDRLKSGDTHPVLAPTVIQINQLANAGKLHLPTLFARGRVVEESLARIVVPLTFFPPSPQMQGKAQVWLPKEWSLLPGVDPASQVETLRFLMAASLILQQDLPEIKPPPPVSRRAVHSMPQLDIPAIGRLMECTRENRNAATINRMAELFEGIGMDPKKARTLRSTMALTFPDREFAEDESPLLDRGVQTYLRGLFDRIPYLMYFLSDASEHVVVLEVAAAYAPDALIRRPQGGIAAALSPQILRTLANLLRNAAEFAVRQGEPREIVLGHLNTIPAEMRERVRMMVLQ